MASICGAALNVQSTPKKMAHILEQIEYISTEVRDGVKYLVDRRAPELQPDGTTIMRDKVTRKAWTTEGTPLPDLGVVSEN